MSSPHCDPCAGGCAHGGDVHQAIAEVVPQRGRLITIREAAERTGIPEASFRKRLPSLGLPFYKIGASVRIDAEELERWIARHRVEPAPLQLVTPAGREAAP